MVIDREKIMSNAAATPQFKRILKEEYASGKHRTSGATLSAAWKRYHDEFPSGPQFHEKSPEQKRRYAERRSFENPRRKKSREMRPRIRVSKRRRIGKLRKRSPLKGYKINRRRQAKVSRNPIAIYNPSSGTKLPATSIEIRYRRTGGSFNGEWFAHRFKGSVSMIGLPNGSVLIKSNSGKKLWGQV